VALGLARFVCCGLFLFKSRERVLKFEIGRLFFWGSKGTSCVIWEEFGGHLCSG